MTAMTVPPEPKKNIAVLKAAWLRQIHKNYLNLLWRNGFGKMPAATLELMKDQKAWGRWDEDKRRILINEDLILNYPWEAVLGILGHETAHQLVSDLGGFDDRRQAPHGPAFKRMGFRLGLDPFYLQASTDLREDCPRPWPDLELPPQSESLKILDKVKKILALSGSSVEGEAQAAMNAAARLMARHNLEALDKAVSIGDEIYESRLIRLESGRIDTRLALIAKILNRHFFVENIFVPAYDPHSDTELKGLELMGRPENIRLAEHVFHFLMERSENLWREYHKKHRGGGHAARNSFIIGLLDGFEAKLNQAAQTDEAGSAEGFSALVLARDQALGDYVQRRHPRLRTVTPGRGRRYCPQSGQAGQKAGRSLNINSPLEQSPHQSSSERRLLGSGQLPG